MNVVPWLSLHPITADDPDTAVGLTVSPEQRHFIASNAESLAEAAHNDACRPMLIREGDVAMGFAMVALDSDDGNQWIYRFMIDQGQQRRGYGTKALELLVRHVFAETECPRIMLGVKPDNVVALNLYKRAGFRPAGFEFDGEVALCLERPASLTR